MSTCVLIFDLVLHSFVFSTTSAENKYWSFSCTALNCRASPLKGRLFMKPLFRRPVFFVMLFVLSLLPGIAAAECLPPATVGIVICQPSPNATIFQTPHFEAAVNPTSGSVTDISVLIDGKQVFNNLGTPLSLFTGAANGKHTLLLNATDSFGRHSTATPSFTVIGNTPACPPPAVVGVRICAPVQGDVV